MHRIKFERKRTTKRTQKQEKKTRSDSCCCPPTDNDGDCGRHTHIHKYIEKHTYI